MLVCLTIILAEDTCAALLRNLGLLKNLSLVENNPMQKWRHGLHKKPKNGGKTQQMHKKAMSSFISCKSLYDLVFDCELKYQIMYFFICFIIHI